MLSRGGVLAEMEEKLDELDTGKNAATQAAGELDGSGLDWACRKAQGLIADELNRLGRRPPRCPPRPDRW